VKNRPAARRDSLSVTRKGKQGSRHLKNQSPLNYKILFSFRKRGLYRYISHLDLMMLLIRLGRIAGIPFKYTSGFNPKPRVTVPFPIPLGIESAYELAEVTLESPMTGDEFRNRLNVRGISDLEVLQAIRYDGKRSIASQNHFHDYHVHMGVVERERESLIASFMGLEQRDEIDRVPRSFFSVRDDCIFLRLEGNMSIKKAFGRDHDAYLDYPIERVMLWRVGEGQLVSFLQQGRQNAK
jgi:hypothetical protein